MRVTEGTPKKISDDPAFRITWLENKLSASLLHRALEGLSLGHHIDGWPVFDGSISYFFFKNSLRKPTETEFSVQGLTHYFGSSLTFTAKSDGIRSQVTVYPSSTVFEHLQGGCFRAVFLWNYRIQGICDVEILSMSGEGAFTNTWNSVKEYVPYLSDPRAHYWENLLIMRDELEGILIPSDHLSLGWVDCYQREVSALLSAIDSAKDWGSISHGEPKLPSEISAFLDVVSGSELSVSKLLEFVAKIYARGHKAIADFLASQPAYLEYCHSISGHSHCSIMGIAVDLFFMSSNISNEGNRLAYFIARTGQISYLDLEPDQFPKAFSPGDYWRRLPNFLLPDPGGLLTGRDVPIDLTPWSLHWKSFPIAKDPSAEIVAADLLIDEALLMKKWTIPNGAVLKLRVPPFAFFEIWESDNEVTFVGRTDKGEFSIIVLGLMNKTLWFDGRITLQKDSTDQILAALKLLFSAIVRDFYVVELREHVFSVSQEKRLPVERLRREGPVTPGFCM